MSPSRLAPTIRRHSSVSAPVIGPRSITPALLTSTSTRPSSDFARSMSECAAASSETSHVTASASPPMREASASMRSERRAASTTPNPASARATAVASPIPDEAPVTTATRSDMSESLRTKDQGPRTRNKGPPERTALSYSLAGVYPRVPGLRVPVCNVCLHSDISSRQLQNKPGVKLCRAVQRSRHDHGRALAPGHYLDRVHDSLHQGKAA